MNYIQKLKIITFIFKEHPLNYNYKGLCDNRDWLFSNNNFYPSFFKFWNASKKRIRAIKYSYGQLKLFIFI